MNKLLFFSLLVLCSSVNALEISYPMFKTCYLDANSVPHQVTRNFTKAMKDAMLGGRGVVFNKKPPGLISEPNKYLGFYVSSPIIPSIDGPNCIVDYTTNTLECSIHNSRSLFWNLPPQAMPMFYEEFVQENLDLGTTQGQFDGLINLLVMAMNDAGNGYVSIDGFGRLRTTENGTMVGYSGIEYVDFNSFMATSASVSPYTGDCADFVGKGTSNPETLGIGGIIAGGFIIENVTGTAPVPIGTSAIVSIAVMADGYYTLRYQYPNDFFGPPKTILNTDVNKIVLTTGSGNEQIEISVFSKDLLPTSVTPINQPIQKPFRIGTTGVKNEKKYPELKLERNAGYKYECSVTGGGTCVPSGGTVNYQPGTVVTTPTLTGGGLGQATVTGAVSGGELVDGKTFLRYPGFIVKILVDIPTQPYKIAELELLKEDGSSVGYIANLFASVPCLSGSLWSMFDGNLTTFCEVTDRITVLGDLTAFDTKLTKVRVKFVDDEKIYNFGAAGQRVSEYGQSWFSPSTGKTFEVNVPKPWEPDNLFMEDNSYCTPCTAEVTGVPPLGGVLTQGVVSGGMLTGSAGTGTWAGGISGGVQTGTSSATLVGSVSGGTIVGSETHRGSPTWSVSFAFTAVSVAINELRFLNGSGTRVFPTAINGSCSAGTMANLSDNNAGTACTVNTASHPNRIVTFYGTMANMNSIANVTMNMNASSVVNNFLFSQSPLNRQSFAAATSVTYAVGNWTTVMTDTHACSAVSDTHACSLSDTHACSPVVDTHSCSCLNDEHTCTECNSTNATMTPFVCGVPTATCNWNYSPQPSCTATPCSCSGGTGGGCTVNKVADPLAMLGFLTPTNTVTAPWRDGYFETGSDFGDLDSGNYSASCLFEEKYFKVQVVKTGTGTGTVTVNPIGGTSCGVDCWKYPENTQIGLVAVPSSDSTMAGWTGCNAIFALDGDKNCTVTFNLKPPPGASTCPTANVCVDSLRTLLATTLGQYGTTVIDDVGYLTITLEDGTVITGFVTRLVKDGDPAPGSVATLPEVVTRRYSGESSILRNDIDTMDCSKWGAQQQLCLDRKAELEVLYLALQTPYTPDQYDPLESDFKAANLTDAEVTPLADMDGNGLVDYEVKINGTPDYYGMMYITSVR